MAPTRLSDGQKSEIVARFREGESSLDLASAFSCSAATVTRVVKAALSADDYEQLKAQRGRRSRAVEEPPAGPEAVAESEPEELPQALAQPGEALSEPVEAESVTAEPAPAEPQNDEPPGSAGVLAIDDADDFGGDDDDDFAEDDGVEGDAFTPIPVALAFDDHTVSEARPLVGAALPASAYMLVDKTVELQARPLSELPELGRLPPGEETRQALVVYANPRQAKRQCGRTQRVIKLPDPSLLERTAPYLLAQGISRVVIEGALYALPGS